MMITQYHILILMALGTYYTLTRAQVQRLCCPKDKDGRATRYRLQQLLDLGLIFKVFMEVQNPRDPNSRCPVYVITKKGLEFLACELKDESWLKCCCQTPNWQHLLHWITVAEFHIMLVASIALQTAATLAGWLGEWDTADLKAKEPEKRYLLFSLITEKPRLVCNPDFAFLLDTLGFRKIFYGEIDRGSSGIQQITHSKPPGFAALAEKQLHKRHFDTNMNTFIVLHVSPTPKRRDMIRKAMKGKPGAEMWKFCSWTDLKPETLLQGPIWYRIEGEGGPLVKTQ